MDRTLSFKQHALNTKAEINTRNNLLRKLTTSRWGAHPATVGLRTTALALCFSTAEFACSSWGRSMNTGHVDIVLNDTCWIVTGCLKASPIPCLYALAGIPPPHIRRKVASNADRCPKKMTRDTHPCQAHDSIQRQISWLNRSTYHLKTRCSYHIVGRGVERPYWWSINWVAWQRNHPKRILGQRHGWSLVHLEEFESAESAERTLPGYDENLEALSYRCMWLWGETHHMSHLMTCVDAPIATGQTCLCQPLSVSTVPNTGRNLSNSISRTRLVVCHNRFLSLLLVQ